MAAVENLFAIHPVCLAVADERRTIGRKLALRLSGQIYDPQILRAHVSDELAVGTEGREFFAAGLLGEAGGAGAVKVTEV